MIARRLCSLLLIFFASSLHSEVHVTPFFSTRSQGRNTPRNLSGWTNYIYQFDQEDTVYGALSATPEYTQSFRHKRITNCLFGDNLVNTEDPQLNISGSDIANRGEKDLLADYFYLPRDFQSALEFKPRIDNFLVDFSFYLGLDAWSKGLYFTFHAPLVHTRWDLKITESNIKPGNTPHPAGSFAQTPVSRNQLLDDFIEYANGGTIINVPNITYQTLQFAKMSDTKLRKTNLAEIRATIGWNFYLEDNYHAGINVQCAAPTGSRPKGEFLFEPIIGNGHHWEIGFGLNGHYQCWNNENKTSHLSLHGDVQLNHLFKARQKRTFDLKRNGTLSRYMLAQTLRSNTNSNPRLSGASDATVEFANELLPVANITTLKVDVSVGIQVDAVLMVNFTYDNFSLDIGYNYWARSCEKIKLRAVDSFAEKTFALKGDAHVIGFERTQTDGINRPVNLAATQNRATIHTGTNLGQPNLIQNPGIDFPVAAVSNTMVNLTNDIIDAAPGVNSQTQTSVPPLFITQNDLNIDGARTRGSSCKLFTNLSYTWQRDDWKPYMGIGGEVEFDHNSKQNTSDCTKSTASQWGIWIKSGVAFD